MRNEYSGEVTHFAAGVASADPCAPVKVAHKTRLLVRKAGFPVTIRFTDTKRFKRRHDLPQLALDLDVNARGRARVLPTYDAVKRGVPAPSVVVRPR